MTTDATATNSIKYVYLEMILSKDSKYDVMAGLFKGIVKKGDKKFILLQGLKNSTNVLCVSFYDIMTVEVCSGDFRDYTYLTCDKSDQEIASRMVEELHKRLLTAGFGIQDDPEVIDVTKYTGVPDKYANAKPFSGTTNSGVGNFVSPHTRYQNTNNNYVRQTNVKPDPTPAVIKRTKTKKPTKTALTSMLAKIQQIQAGEYTVTLPSIMGTDANGVTDAADTDEDYYTMYRNGGYYR